MGDLISDAYNSEVYFFRVQNDDELVKQIAIIKFMLASYGQRLITNCDNTVSKKYFSRHIMYLLFVDKTMCSCESLDFVGTAGPIIAENIALI